MRGANANAAELGGGVEEREVGVFENPPPGCGPGGLRHQNIPSESSVLRFQGRRLVIDWRKSEETWIRPG